MSTMSSQPRFVLATVRRNLSLLAPRRKLLSYQHPYYSTSNSPLGTSPLSHFHHSISGNNRNDDTKSSTTAPARLLGGLPLIRSSWSANTNNHHVNLRVGSFFPLATSTNPYGGVYSFSTTTDDDDDNKKKAASIRETAAHYRDQASHYTDQAKDGAKSFGGMMKKYGPTFLWTYLSVYVTTLGGLYVGVESGALDPVLMLGYITGNHEDLRSSAEVVAELLKHYTLTERFADTVQQKPALANFAVAWISTKFTEPIRFGVTMAIVPRVARYFGFVPGRVPVEGISNKDKQQDSDKDTLSLEQDDQSTRPTAKPQNDINLQTKESKQEEKKPQ
jgi:Protein of unknown function (DUF1279)